MTSTKRAATSQGKPINSPSRRRSTIRGGLQGRKADTIEQANNSQHVRLVDTTGGGAATENGTIDFSGGAAEPLDTSVVDSDAHYKCPLYKTQARFGTLLTTGHSTNFITMVNTPMPQTLKEDGAETISQKTRTTVERTTSNHWIKRGAAMVCSLSH